MKNYISKFSLLLLLLIFFAACQQEEKLPILGNRDVVNGKTIYHTIPDFQFIDQDSSQVNNTTFKDKIYIANDFFTSCPTICPKVKQQMLRIYDRFEDEEQLKFLSLSIDTRNDNVAKLKKYATKLDIDAQRWHLVTGEKDHIYDVCDDFFLVAKEDPDAPGGFDHSGILILVDKNQRVRAFADGTNPEKVDEMMKNIEKLLKEG